MTFHDQDFAEIIKSTNLLIDVSDYTGICFVRRCFEYQFIMPTSKHDFDGKQLGITLHFCTIKKR